MTIGMKDMHREKANISTRPGASTSTCTWYLYLITLFQVLVLDS